MIVLGPPRSGKGYNIVIPMLLDAPGAVITTATRADNLSVTITARAARGPWACSTRRGWPQASPRHCAGPPCGVVSARRPP